MKTLDKMTDEERKALPIYDGCFYYFPNAVVLCAQQSKDGQMQHGADKPLQWHREKSRDELGSLSRHILDFSIAEQTDDYEGMLTATKAIVWRAMAHAERFMSTCDQDPERYHRIQELREGDK